jgi:hypothetical protein
MNKIICCVDNCCLSLRASLEEVHKTLYIIYICVCVCVCVCLCSFFLLLIGGLKHPKNPH